MSKGKARSDESAEAVLAEPAHAPQRPQRSVFFSPVVLGLIGVIVLVGVVSSVSRPSRNERDMNEALSTADVGLVVDRDGRPDRNGLSDTYALLRFARNHELVAKYIGSCHTDTELALKVFRPALEKGNRSAKMIAIYSAFFLAENRALTAEDWSRLMDRLNPEKETDADVRRIAQRTVSDLILLENPKLHYKYSAAPSGFLEDTTDDPPIQIETKEFQHAGGAYLGVRWSSPKLAWAWLKIHSARGTWKPELGRFLISPPQ